MSTIHEYLEARENYISLIKSELLGPGSEISIPDKEHELVTNSPDVRYSIGILFPRNNKLNADNDDSAKVEPSSDEEELEPDLHSDGDREEHTKDTDPTLPAEEDNLDEEISLAAQNMPSSRGAFLNGYQSGSADPGTLCYQFQAQLPAQAGQADLLTHLCQDLPCLRHDDRSFFCHAQSPPNINYTILFRRLCQLYLKLSTFFFQAFFDKVPSSEDNVQSPVGIHLHTLNHLVDDGIVVLHLFGCSVGDDLL